MFLKAPLGWRLKMVGLQMIAIMQVSFQDYAGLSWNYKVSLYTFGCFLWFSFLQLGDQNPEASVPRKGPWLKAHGVSHCILFIRIVKETNQNQGLLTQIVFLGIVAIFNLLGTYYCGLCMFCFRCIKELTSVISFHIRKLSALSGL